MRVHSFLVQGPNTLSALSSQLSQTASSITQFPPHSLDALALFHLGIPRTDLAAAVKSSLQSSGIKCPLIYLADSYGIIGYDDALGRNVELMEKGRGQEYGYRGGSGGEGCVAVIFSSGAVAGHGDMEFPNDLASMMAIADTSGEFKRVSSVPVYYGGISKENYLLRENTDEMERIPYFWVGSREGDLPVGISTFEGEAGEATDKLLEKLPEGYKVSGDVALFPCFTRGVNHYGEEDVETSAISKSFSGKGGMSGVPAVPRCYGMFAHGELGPSQFMGFVKDDGNIPCKQHSMTSILSIHTVDSSNLGLN